MQYFSVVVSTSIVINKHMSRPFRNNSKGYSIYLRAVSYSLAFLHRLHPGWSGQCTMQVAIPKGRSIFYLPHWPKFSDFFDLCLHWVSVVLGSSHTVLLSQKGCVFGKSVEKGTNKGTHLYYETAADSTTTTLAPKMHFGFVF